MTKLINRLFTYLSLDYFPVVLLLFIAGWALDNLFNTAIFRLIPGTILLAVLPGYYGLKLIGLPRPEWNWPGRLTLYWITSLSICIIVQFIAKNFIAFTAISQIAMLFLINSGLYILIKLLSFPTDTKTPIWRSLPSLTRSAQTQQSAKNYRYYWLLFLPLLVYALTFILNPTVDNADGYLDILINSITNKLNPLLYPRIFFIPLLGLYHFVTGIDPVFIFKFFLTFSFYISLFIGFDYIYRSITHPTLRAISYLAVLAPAVIAIEASIVRPQLVIMLFTFPILFLLIDGLKHKDYRLLGLAIVFSFITLGFHELGAVLVAITLPVGLIVLARSIFITKELRPTIKQLILLAIILFPYTQLINLPGLLQPIMQKITYAGSFITGLNWDWWFIDNYTTIDGYQVGWPGIQALHYYLYNGILFIGALLILGLILKLTRRYPVAQPNRWLLAVPLLYVAYYTVFAEVLPRIGLFFLPNRAWPHLMLGLVVFAILLIERHQQAYQQHLRLTAGLVLAATLPGILAIAYLTYNRVGTVFPEELAAVRFIKNELPANSAFTSTQPNYDLIKFYAKRPFISLRETSTDGSFTNQPVFEQTVATFLERTTTAEPPFIVPEQSTITTYMSGDTVLSSSRVVTMPAREVIPEPRIKNDQPVYFIYSHKKLSGLNGQRHYNQKLLDPGSAAFFKTLNTDSVIYRDDSVVIVKVR